MNIRWINNYRVLLLVYLEYRGNNTYVIQENTALDENNVLPVNMKLMRIIRKFWSNTFTLQLTIVRFFLDS